APCSVAAATMPWPRGPIALEPRMTARRPIGGSYVERSAFAAGLELGDGLVVVDDRGRVVEGLEAFHQPGPEDRLAVDARQLRHPAAHVDPVGVEAFGLADGG